MDPYTFVRNLAANRRAEQAGALRAPDPAHLMILHPALCVAIRHRSLIQPVLAEQVSRHSLVGVPDSDPAVITAWIAEHKGCNFALSLEESGVFALRIEPYQCLDAIAWLLHRDGREWQHTLQFKSGDHHYSLFVADFRPGGVASGGIRLAFHRLLTLSSLNKIKDFSNVRSAPLQGGATRGKRREGSVGGALRME